ncbi:hypothetical protein [Rhodoblastus sp.]|uniref:DUF6967 family protein n=1 Tax=Rhodoblastus sp. TaxID=1962975 RepID=UPI002636C27F|nr:hypothetical protein [Rhodoblastus sp.]
MTTAPKREIGEIEAPYRRRIKLDEIDYGSGMALLRLTIREGARYTILEIDDETAEKWGQMMLDWAAGQKGRK